MGIRITYKGELSSTEKYLTRLKHFNRSLEDKLRKYGDRGVKALHDYTPKDTGVTADSWYYKIKHDDKHVEITWCNSSVNKGVPIAVVLQYGHGTGTGGWVEGVDYINPALKRVFEDILQESWKEVTDR